MNRLSKYVLAFFLMLTLSATARASMPTIMEEKDILPYLEKMISWHRQGAALETSPELPRELILKNALQEHTTQALNGSFDYARALAETLPETPKPATEEKTESDSREAGLKKAITLAVQKSQQLQVALDHTKTHASRDMLAGQLKLSQEHLNLLREIAETVGVSDEEDTSLTHKINQLAGTITELDGTQKKTAAQEPAVQEAAAPPASGILGEMTRIYSFAQAKSTVKGLLNDTKSLYNDNKDRGQIIRDALKGIMQEGQTLGDTSGNKNTAPDAKQPKPDTSKAAPSKTEADTSKTPAVTAPPPTYDDLVSEMKKLSKVAVALSQTNKALTLCINDLSDWSGLINQHIRDLLTNLVFRLAMLGLAIGIAAVLSTLASKATRRYVTDRRRRDQLRIVRKATLLFTVAIILFLGFFTDLNSLATFAGLLTAGVAFALKDVLLSVIAYFQFFSTSDIHPGDSITISGVTGKITQIGMLRFYMMEMEKSDVGFLPTGRIVGFSNSILFQPAPFFRQTPGTNFVWSEIAISLAPAIDHALAYNKLNKIVERIYAKQRENIRKSEAILQKNSPFKLEVSVPQTYFRFTNMGIVFVIRYAVEREQAQSLHLQMTTELLAEIKKDPDLQIMHIA